MLRPRLGTPWVGFLRNWRMLWIAQTDSKDSTDSVYYTHIYLTIFPIVIVMDNIASLLFGNGLAIGIWISDWDLGIRICLWLWLLHALFFIHASLARGYQQTRWYIVRIQAADQAWVCMSGQLGHKVSTVAATATVLRAACKTFCISSQRYFCGQATTIFRWNLSDAVESCNVLGSIWIMEMIMRLPMCVTWVPFRAAVAAVVVVARNRNLHLTQPQPTPTATCHNGHMQQSSESLAQLNSLYCTTIISTCRKIKENRAEPNSNQLKLCCSTRAPRLFNWVD